VYGSNYRGKWAVGLTEVIGFGPSNNLCHSKELSMANGDDNNYDITINITPQHLSNTLWVFVQITSQTPLTHIIKTIKHYNNNNKNRNSLPT